MNKIYFILVILLFSYTGKLAAQSSFATRVIADNLFIPWEIVYGPDDHIWFTQKNGYVCRLNPNTGTIDTLLLESQNVIRGEGGMLGLAVHPTFISDPYVFVAYQYEDGGDYKERVVKYTYANNTLINPQILIDDIEGGNIHNGCRLEIVADKLFITTGDAGNTALAQNVASLNGKVLRINLDGSIPTDNPMAGSAVWSWGHRNAQGLAFHNGIMYSSEHGPNNDDEVNIISMGRNYGWPNVQGFCNTPTESAFCADSNVVEPLYAWTPTIAVSGMAYYNHPMFPAYANTLLMTTLKDSKLYKLQLNAAGDSITNIVSLPDLNYGRLRDITVSPDGRIFISTSNSPASGTGAKVDKIIELYDSTLTNIYNLMPDNGMILVYPNPALDIMNIGFLNDEMKTSTWNYTITNVRGQVEREHALEFDNIDVGSLFSGVYFLKMWNEKNVMIHKRFVKW